MNIKKGQRQKNLEAKKIRDEIEEERRKQLDREEAEYQAQKRKEALQKAQTQLYYQSDPVRGLHVGVASQCHSRGRVQGHGGLIPLPLTSTERAPAGRGSEGEGGADRPEATHQKHQQGREERVPGCDEEQGG